MLRAGVDIGGTFTDLCVVDDGRVVAVGKALTTPRDPSQAVETVLVDALERLGAGFAELGLVVHGTTLVTNAIIERRGSRTALLTTEGFRDAVEIGRERRYELYDLMVELPRPLVPRHLRFDVPERTLAGGGIAVELDEPHVERLARELAESGVEAVAVSFLHSFTNPEHERRAREAILRAAPAMRVSLSSEVVPELREYERTSTTVANVYVQALIDRYLTDLRSRLELLGFGGRLYLMLSSGGIATVETASRFPIRLLESGPAAGALAAAAYGRASGHRDLVSFDMGGTTAKLCVVEDGAPLVADEFEVDRVYRLRRGSGLPVKLPVVDMIEIGVGGGSIAAVDTLGLLKVGPRSAGADPGPACYGLGGTEPTVTDADLVLGYLDPGYFLGGKMRLDADSARAAVERSLAGPLGLTVEQAAWGVHQVVNENMANAARVHAVERGLDPTALPLFAFGGAGPVHAVGVAAALGSPSVIAPLGAGVISALGFLTAPLAFDFVHSWRCPLDGVDWSRVNAFVAEMETEGATLLVESGLEPEQVSHTRYADLRYVGQGHEVRIALPPGALGPDADLVGLFEREYERLFGRSGPGVPVEAINWRVVSSGPPPGLELGAIDVEAGAEREREPRQAYFPALGGFVETAVYDRYALEPGARFEGPAIVEERESTLVVGPGQSVEVAADLSLTVTLGGSR
ncbi:MAG TPA: hydantoinase/oxoprolinase family protein [Gaiellaceae bacterium]|nr:hydantoinase/oxoprolinase family protein [Gaiellaceae bacterium]